MNLARIAKAAFSLVLVAALSACMHHHGHHHGGGKGCCGSEQCKSMKCEKSGGDCCAQKSGCPMSGGASGCCKK